ncbi:helix-turn-helix domain-containing protein [Actinomadura decatromicini]|uniref:Helix-turn-helix domain-containing protein n=1 Tax=Actinomadura decatromicini TaxID=2604572 RepID=A0A5D3FNI6_9ACTN|nr:helix-turn-helix transcriptional regulator [Actinomadura decatromicini]TYK49572.1 helix-turn-helix domain-containing protein [Actinomadura decatromicini]
MTFGERMRQLMQEQDVSLRRLAKAVPCNVGYLSKVARDLGGPSEDLAKRLDELLGAGGELAGLRRPPQRPTSVKAGDADRLRHAARKPLRVDPATVEALARVLDGQRRLEDSVGSAAVLPAVRVQLKSITSMVTEARGPIRNDLLDVAAQWSQFGGWLYASVGRPGDALKSLGRTLEWATESGNQQIVGEVLSWQGYVAERRGQIGAMIGLSQAAQRLRAGSVGRVYDLYQEARALAAVGEADAVRRLTEQAAAAVVDVRPDVARPWEYYYFAPGFFVLEHGLAYRILGRTDPAYNAVAIEHLKAGLDGLPANMRASEWAGDFVYQLAMAYLQIGEAGEAERVAADLETIATRTGSDRLTGLLAALR